MKFFDENSVGCVLARIGNDIYVTDDFLPWSFHNFLENCMTAFGYPIGIII